MSLADSEFSEDPGMDDGFGAEGFDEGMDMSEGEVSAPNIPAAPMYRKQTFSIYSVMLILSFVFLLVATIMFFMEAGRLEGN